MFNAAADCYKEFLPDALDYLSSRGLGIRDAQYARLGMVGDPMPGHELYKSRLSIPYITANGQVKDLRFRSMDGNEPKYLSVPNSVTRLYEVRSLASGPDQVVVCEGELDTLVARKALGVAAVGIPGASHWDANEHWHNLLSGVSEVYVVCDADDAGRNLAKSIARTVSQAQVVNLPDGMDITDFYMEHGSEELMHVVGI